MDYLKVCKFVVSQCCSKLSGRGQFRSNSTTNSINTGCSRKIDFFPNSLQPILCMWESNSPRDLIVTVIPTGCPIEAKFWKGNKILGIKTIFPEHPVQYSIQRQFIYDERNTEHILGVQKNVHNFATSPSSSLRCYLSFRK